MDGAGDLGAGDAVDRRVVHLQGSAEGTLGQALDIQAPIT
jgi:hypothetical protein